MKKTKEILKILITSLCIIFAFSSASFAATVGVYETVDGTHKIEVKDDGSILYDDTYALTLTEADTGNKLTGSIGTNKKAVTFNELNDTTWVSNATVTYTHNSASVYLHEYTSFHLNSFEPIVNENGIYEVWSGNEKTNIYTDLQSAIDASKSGDTIKITSGEKVTAGAYVKDKVITIDACNNILDKSSWINPLFIVEENATLNLKNMIIDGGATGFEVNYDGVTFADFNIPLIAGSDSNDPKMSFSTIITKGTLVTDGIEMNNLYSTGAGAAIRVISGKINIVNSSFEHNRSNNGGAIYIGSELKQNQTEYPVQSVIINNSEFLKNYSNGSGGAIHIYNTTDVKINDSFFTSNTTNGSGGYGGAIILNKQSSAASKAGLTFIQAKIDNCEFIENWCGNDGFAIQNYDAELETTNSIFKENVGVHPSSSVATYSMQVNAKSAWPKEKLKGCTFEANKGAVSCIADHGGQVLLTIEDCQFTENIGSATCYFLTSIINMKNCNFISEIVTLGVIEGNSYSEPSEYTKLEDYKAPHIILEDCNFENSDNPDILLHRNDARYPLNNQLHILGEVNANVHVRHGMDVVVKGTLNGNITAERDTTSEDITILESGKVNGDISYMENSYYALIRYNIGESVQIFNYDQKMIYLEANRVYTPAELYSIHSIGSGDAKLEYYTDSARTTLWDYKMTANATLYTKWVEHEHTYTDELFVTDNTIVKVCECGYYDKCLKLELPSNLVYDGKIKEVSIDNAIELPETEYELVYKQQKDTDWEELENAPTNVGSYKAVLTADGDKTIELEYAITKAIPSIAVDNLSQIDVSITPVTYTITPEVTDGIVRIEYKESTAEDSSYTETLPTVAGTYLVRINLTGDSNLEDTEKTETLTITKRTSTGGSSVTRYKIEVIKSEGGTITPDTCSVKRGSDKTFEIEAEDGYEIEDVLVDGESVGAISSYTFENVKAKHTIEVIFKLIEEEREEAWENPFKDVNEKDWYYEAVKFANQNKLFNGMSDDEFGPNVEMTRGMLVTVLYRLENEPAINKSVPFADVGLSMYYANAVIWAKQNNIVNGVDFEHFAPDAQITREQLVTILYRYAEYKQKDVSVGENTNILSYDDFNELSEYSIPAMQWACGSGIITGRTASTLVPKGTATRAEVATMLMRFMK